MTERERIEANIDRTRELIACEFRAIERNRECIDQWKAELAALPPDNPDLSAWRPDQKSRYFFVDGSGKVSQGNCAGHDYQLRAYYETRAEAERAANRQKLHTRLWQCHHRLYGAGGGGILVGCDFTYT